MKSVLDTEVSYYRNYNDTTPVTINLMNFIEARKHKTEVDRIRMMEDKKDRDEAKSKLPCITPSGTFSYRNEKSIIKHSGLVQFDIDFKGNEHIENFEQIGAEISKLPYIAYVGYSCSGYGFWGLIPIAYPDKHKLHLKAFIDILKYHGIKCDTAPSNVASLRGYSYDDSAYINHNAELFTYVHVQEDIVRQPSERVYELNTEGLFKRAIKKTQEKEIFCDGAKHCFLVKLAGYCNAMGIDESTCIDMVESNFRCLTDGSVDLKKPIENVYRTYRPQNAEYSR